MQAIFALAGVIVGVLLKAVFDILLENRRWAKENRQYFKNKRIDSYSSFIASAQDMALRSWSIHESSKDDEYVELSRKFLSDYQVVYMLAGSSVRNVANGVLEAVNRCSPMCGVKPTTKADLDVNQTMLYQRTTLFQDQVQKELEIF